ncbi:MAG: AAA family ATPase [Desulfuromonadaceae bacterium]|nr:AAA family ATPase [Desulfuromonadaceae bacterium]MDD2855800.1 AAA family ATPase [Desulfuromonadaceae bacterium]
MTVPAQASASLQEKQKHFWHDEILRLLPIRSQFVLSGNIRDIFIVNNGLVPALDALWARLKERGYKFMAVYDRSDGLSLSYVDSQFRAQVDALLGGGKDVSLDRLPQIIRNVATSRELRGALVIDYASRLMQNGEPYSEHAANLFVSSEKYANTAAAIFVKDVDAVPLYNPVIWLVNRDNDLPSWLTLDSELIASIIIPRPDFQDREQAASQLLGQFEGGASATPAEKSRFASEFATLTEGLTLRGMFSVAMLAKKEKIFLTDVDDAVRNYKVGISESPWKKPYLRDKVREAGASICKRVKGQERAVTKSLDILIRSIMGMTGAQSRTAGGKPRGVLFFAGPTGVGKTELAKSITETLFGDDRAYIRFDMSEFSQEHSDARLLGAPPGYVGYEAGGELTKAVRSRPFSVLLFDEIEKAHPRILDKFLQILEDGRLTDGQGQTVYFSESVIIFTSNLGIYINAPDGSRVQNVKPGDPYETVEKNVNDAIGHHFKFVLNRPEILNRIGDNVVVFNFITPDVSQKIFDGMFDNVLARVKEEHGITLQIDEDLRSKIRSTATADLSNGGRGIGNRIESLFVEPLARALFERNITSGTNLIISDWAETPAGYKLVLT